MTRWKWPAVLLLTLANAQADPPDGYYDTADRASPEALRTSLHAIIEDHTRLPYTSFETDTWDILEMADQDPNDSGRIVTIYRNASFAKRGGGNDDYNREHTWPRSYGFPDNDENLNYPFTDMHHLFLSDGDYNFARSNKPYQDCHDRCAEWETEANAGQGGEGGIYPADSNWTTGLFTDGRWEVWKARRGDIARAMFYMDVRYEGGNHGMTGATEPDLILTNDRDLIDRGNTGVNRSVAYMGILEDLLRWHLEDPVDAVEIQHHEAVFAAQGNRNPFIDNPAWVACIFLDDCGFEINPGLNDAWFNEVTAGQGFFIIVFEDTGIIFLAWFTYDTALPPDDVAAFLGAAEHRWLTAQGPYDGDTAALEVFLTEGGIFDMSEPAPITGDPIGTITIKWTDCENGVLTYDIDPPGVMGEIPITRIVPDNVALCEALANP